MTWWPGSDQRGRRDQPSAAGTTARASAGDCWLLPRAAALAFGGVTLALADVGYRAIFSFFAPWDDEGYLLVSLRSFHRGGRLYDEVYTQYGPLFFQLIDGLFTVLRLPLNHNNGRLASLGLWLAVSLICGLAVRGMACSVALGCCAQILVFLSLLPSIALEPMHPGGLLCLGLAGLAGTTLMATSRPRFAWAVQGFLVASLALVKINVGVFALLAVSLECVTAFPLLARHRLLMLAAASLAVAAPVALMAAHLSQPWVQLYAWQTTAALLAVTVVLIGGKPDPRLDGSHLLWLIGGAMVTAAVVVAGILLRGTSAIGMVQALLVLPFHQSSVFAVPLVLPAASGAAATASLLAGLAVAWRRGRPAVGDPNSSDHLAAGLVRLAAGLASVVWVFGVADDWSLGFAVAPFAWIAAVPPAGLGEPPRLAAARRLWPILAALQLLHAYPVAGSQELWSSFLLVPVGFITLTDAARQLAAWAQGRGWRSPTPAGRFRSTLAGALAITVTGLASRRPLLEARAAYDNGTPLALPGAGRLHLPGEQEATLVWLVGEIRQHCAMFVSVPGLNSLYLWTEQEPPTGLNATSWMYLFPSDLQARIVERIRGVDRLCFVLNPEELASWQQGRPLPRGPLLDFLRHGFAPVGSRADYQIFVRSMKSSPAP